MTLAAPQDLAGLGEFSRVLAAEAEQAPGFLQWILLRGAGQQVIWCAIWEDSATADDAAGVIARAARVLEITAESPVTVERLEVLGAHRAPGAPARDT